MMALANHSAWMGVTPRTIYATGGASANPDILQVMADVFDADVLRFDATDSAALGCGTARVSRRTLVCRGTKSSKGSSVPTRLP